VKRVNYSNQDAKNAKDMFDEKKDLFGSIFQFASSHK
jgi:hypothetical protein